MTDSKPTPLGTTEAQDIAQQAKVELAILLQIEQGLRLALQWMMRGRGNTHKLSTLRFGAWSFERHMTRIQILTDHSGYLHVITKANPHLASDVAALKCERAELHDRLDSIIRRLDLVAHDDSDAFGRVCADLEGLLDDLRVHGQKEGELRQHSFSQEDGGSG